MKKLLVLLLIPLFFACSSDGDCSSDSIITNKELAEQVKEHMAEVFKENPELENIEIDDLILIRYGSANYEGSYKYQGKLTLIDDDYWAANGLSVLVDFDGETFRWKISSFGFTLFDAYYYSYANLR